MGRTINDRYKVLLRLGAGGAGEVFEAEDLQHAKRVAIKVVSMANTSEDAILRLRREAQVIASLRHRNVCGLYDFGTIAGSDTPFLVLERLYGQTLEQALRQRRKMPVARAIELLSQVLAGVETAHRAGIIHRDLKPANVFIIEPAGERPIVKLLDFGFATDIEGRFQQMTRPGRACGTPSYMSPEQLLAQPLTPSSDIFSVGLMLYQAVVGVHPFESKSVVETSLRIVHEQMTSARLLRPSLPSALEGVLERALEKEPHLRYQSAAEMRHSLLESVETTDPEIDGESDSSTSVPQLLAANPESTTDSHTPVS
jgi:serine/threonine-protein kinase